MIGEDLKFISCKVNGEDITTESGKITLLKDGSASLTGSLFPIDPEERFTVEFVVKIDPENNTKLTGLFKSSLIYCTQCEAEGFRRITYFLDRPDVMASFTCRVEADKEKCPVLLSNGNKTSEGNLDNNRHFAVYEDPWKKPCYLFALVAGELSSIEGVFTTMSGKDVKLVVYAEPADCKKLEWALHSLKLSMKWDEEKYGREYDLEIFNIVAVGDFNMGAMENKSLNIFNTALLLASPETATDRDYMRVLGVVGHEYFHNWTGNRVTCRSWFELTLKEGLTVFRDQNFSFDQGGAGAKRIEDVSLVRSAQFAEDSGPMAHPVRPDSYLSIENFYTVTVYDKGSEVIKMYHTLLGPEGFRKGTDLYFKRHDGQAVTCDDFLNAMADANPDSKIDFKNEFSRWYSTPGTPLVVVDEATYNAHDKKFILSLSQKPSSHAVKVKKTEPLVIPVRVGLLLKSSGAELKDEVFALTQSKQTFTMDLSSIHGLTDEDEVIPSILRDFSAPVRISFPQQTEEDLLFLMANEKDAVNQWDAGQKVASNLIHHLYSLQINHHKEGSDKSDMLSALPSPAVLAKNPSILPSVVLDAYRKVVVDSAMDETLASLTLTLIDSKALIGSFAADETRSVGGVEPLAVYKARLALNATLAHSLFDEILARYNQLTDAIAAAGSDKYELTPEAIGRRRLRNTLLHLLSSGCESKGDEAVTEFKKLAVNQYNSASNLTDRLAAAASISSFYGSSECTELERRFLEDAQDQQVEDKWFALRASACHDKIFDVIEDLMAHPKFNMRNPNRVRSVVGSVVANPHAFHSHDGKGYSIIADVIIKLDASNPAIAARMATALGDFKKYTDKRQCLMRDSLERITKSTQLSAEVYEVVSKALKQ